MANLTVFLEFIVTKSPYIQRKFEKEFTDLFFSMSTKVDKDGKRDVRWIFERFINAATLPTRIGKNEDGIEDNIPLPDTRD